MSRKKPFATVVGLVVEAENTEAVYGMVGALLNGSPVKRVPSGVQVLASVSELPPSAGGGVEKENTERGRGGAKLYEALLTLPIPPGLHREQVVAAYLQATLFAAGLVGLDDDGKFRDSLLRRIDAKVKEQGGPQVAEWQVEEWLADFPAAHGPVGSA